MPWGYECRANLLKQNKLSPTQRRGSGEEFEYPSPATYEPPQIFCGRGFSKIKRQPAYTFGLNTPVQILKPSSKPNAPMFNVQGQTRKGPRHIPGSLVTPQIDPPVDKLKVPGPGAYSPKIRANYRGPPAYTMRLAAKEPYQPWDQWTPPPNMYCPPIFGKRASVVYLCGPWKDVPPPPYPGPGEYNANFYYGKKGAPKFSLGAPFRPSPSFKTPPPNAYCEKLFMVNKRTIPSPSFGIKHSPYAGQQKDYMKREDLQLANT